MTTTDEEILRHLVGWEFDRVRSALALPAGWRGERFVELVRSQRVTGVTLAAIDGGALVAPPHELRDHLNRAHVTEMQQVLTAESDLVRVARLLDSAGVDFRVLKGLATAHLDHDDPARRSTSDVDVLVRPTDLTRAVDALRPLLQFDDSDGTPSTSNPFAKDLTLKIAGGGWLDLHQLIAPAYWGLSLDTDKLFATSESFVIAETELHSLDRPQRLIHALLHAGYSDDVSMHSVRDCLILGSALGDSLTHELNSVHYRSIRGLLAIGARRSVACLGVDHPLGNWAVDTDVTVRERLALRLTNRTGRGSFLSGVAAISVRRWPALLRPVLSSRLRSSHRSRRRHH